MASNPSFNFKLRSGITVAGRYELGRLLGRGGMGEVWAATHVALDAKHAIKFMEPSLLAEHDADTVLDRFEEEARATSAISRLSRHVVSVSDYGKHDGIPYLVMEHLDGESLEAHMVREKCFPPARVAQILEQICLGVAQAHKAKLIHRDLKPANVFICKDEVGGLLVKVLDFGLVRSTSQGDKRLTKRGIAVGTPNYMSPEQARAHPNMDEQCDYWSMAVLAYEMLTSKSPWVGETMQDVLVAVCRSEFLPVSEVKPELGKHFDAFFARAFQRKAENRFPTGDALTAAFRNSVAAAAEAPVPIAVASSPPPVFTSTDSLLAVPKRSNKKLAFIAILALALISGIALTLHFRKGDEGPMRNGAVSAGPLSTQVSVPPPDSIAPPTPSVASSASASSRANIPPVANGGKPMPTTPVVAAPSVPEKPVSPPPVVDPPRVPPTPTPAVTRGPVDQSKIL